MSRREFTSLKALQDHAEQTDKVCVIQLRAYSWLSPSLGRGQFAASGAVHYRATLETAGALGFFAFTHSRERPDSYHEPFRFDTVPSSPMRHARR